VDVEQAHTIKRIRDNGKVPFATAFPLFALSVTTDGPVAEDGVGVASIAHTVTIFIILIVPEIFLAGRFVLLLSESPGRSIGRGAN
jgi:hypothetical protein